MLYDIEDIFMMARTVYGEARGETYRGQRAVANVILNRAKQPGWWGESILEICLHPKQFSCWNISDSNRRKMLKVRKNDPTFLQCMRAVLEAFEIDETSGATHYYAMGISKPHWANELEETFTLGHHRFFK